MLSQYGFLFIEFALSLIPVALLLLVIAGTRLRCRHLVILTSCHERTKAQDAAVRALAFAEVCARAPKPRRQSVVADLPARRSTRSLTWDAENTPIAV